MNEILQDAEVKKKLIEMGMEIEGSPQRLAETIRRDRLKWEKVIAESNIRID